jgi:hypothetical protein
MTRERRTKIGGQFAPRLIEMLESYAFRALSLSARRVLDRVEIEMARHGGTDNGKLPVTYDDFEAYGIHRHSIAPAIREAVALGFLEVTEAGRAGNAEYRAPNLFRLTYRPAKGLPGDGTHEWRKVGTDLADAELIARMARQQVATKNISQWRKMPKSSGGNRHRKPPIHSADSTTTGHSARTTTTLDISGGSRVCLSSPDRATPQSSPSFPSGPLDRETLDTLPLSLASVDQIEIVDGIRYVDGVMVDTAWSDFDEIAGDRSAWLLGEEVVTLAEQCPGVASVGHLFREACATWLQDVAPEDRRRRFLKWLEARTRDGGFKAKRRISRRVLR